MKVCIVTVYDSVNSGSFLQAKSLGEYLKSINSNIEVYYLKTPALSRLKSNLNLYNIALKKLIKRGPSAFFNQIKTMNKFFELKKEFNEISLKKLKEEKIDLFVLGSDTIWNFDSAFFKNNCCHYLATNFVEGNRVISYAASIANTKEETIKKIPNFKYSIDNYFKISVRDYKTMNVLEKITDKKIEIVCDPTLLFDKEYYEKNIKKIEEKKYIFLYLFEKMSPSQESSLRRFVKKNDLLIISGVSPACDADKYIINEPNIFVNYMANAEYVITDTFHGAIFSINLHKKSIIINRNKNKVNEFLEKNHFEDRIIEANENVEFEEKFDKIKFDYDNLNTLKESSRKYLKDIFEEIKGDKDE